MRTGNTLRNSAPYRADWLQVHPNARKKKAAPKPGSEEEADLQREQSEAQQRQAYQEGACWPACRGDLQEAWL